MDFCVSVFIMNMTFFSTHSFKLNSLCNFFQTGWSVEEIYAQRVLIKSLSVIKIHSSLIVNVLIRFLFMWWEIITVCVTAALQLIPLVSLHHWLRKESGLRLWGWNFYHPCSVAQVRRDGRLCPFKRRNFTDLWGNLCQSVWSDPSALTFLKPSPWGFWRLVERVVKRRDCAVLTARLCWILRVSTKHVLCSPFVSYSTFLHRAGSSNQLDITTPKNLSINLEMDFYSYTFTLFGAETYFSKSRLPDWISRGWCANNKTVQIWAVTQ